MADEDNLQEKTEPATPRKREEARESGKVAYSQDIQSAGTLFVGFVVLYYYGGVMLERIMAFTRSTFINAPYISITADSLGNYFFKISVDFFIICAPFLLVLLVAGIVISFSQTGFVFTTAPLIPNLARVSFSFNKIKNMFSLKAWVKIIFNIIKLIIVARVAYLSIKASLPEMLALVDMEPMQILMFCSNLLFGMLLKVGGLLLILALIDYVYQRWEFEKELRMSKEEMRDEAKRYDGNPQAKTKMRSMQQQMARQRMLTSVPEADVIITNPTHLAVAVKYDLEKMAAPKVIAKGARLLAERIRDIATDNDIPIVENKPLAQALYKTVEVGQDIPAKLYQAVAEILAYVYQLNREKLRSVTNKLRSVAA